MLMCKKDFFSDFLFHEIGSIRVSWEIRISVAFLKNLEYPKEDIFSTSEMDLDVSVSCFIALYLI